MKPRLVRRQANHYPEGYSPLIGRLLSGRGITSDAEASLELAGLLHPDSLKGIDEAASLLADAVCRQASVLIVGDFDADGATSTALMVRVLTAFGAQQVRYLVPDRFIYGYGLTPELVDLAATEQPELIVTVDNGISSLAGVARAKELGIQVLITDHHLPGEALPAADAIVNPNQPGCGFESRALAGVGVAFYLLSRLRKVLEARGWFAGAGISPPAMAGFLDLVALGTVADVVPLDRNNRILVAQGLRRIRAGKCSAGIRTLLSVSGTNLSRVSTRDLAFGAAPRLNAAGRLDDMSIGIACLLAEDDQQALLIAARLDQLNRERREIEKEMKADAEEILKQETARHIRQDQKEQPAGLCLYAAGWHQGVVGILASRIKDRVNRPVIAFAADDEGNLKGSGRSIKGFHIRDALAHIDAMNPGMISRFGGHAMAAGLTLPAPHLQQFRDCFNHLAGQWLSAEALEMTIVTDGELTQKLSVKDVHEVLQSMPWGQGFPEPLFDGEFQIIDQRIVGGRHLKLKLDNGWQRFDAIAFNQDRLLEGQRQHLVYRLDVNEYRNLESVQLIIDTIL